MFGSLSVPLAIITPAKIASCSSPASRQRTWPMVHLQYGCRWEVRRTLRDMSDCFGFDQTALKRFAHAQCLVILIACSLSTFPIDLRPTVHEQSNQTTRWENASLAPTDEALSIISDREIYAASPKNPKPSGGNLAKHVEGMIHYLIQF